MSSRPGVQVTVKREADGGEHPNRYIGLVSAHVRVYWPPLADIREVYKALDDAHNEALDAIYDKFYPDNEEETNEA